MTPDRTGGCAACGAADLAQFADLGDIPVLCGVHYATREEALASPLGRMTLGYCRNCAYVRNLAFDPEVMVYDTTMDTNLHHSAAFRSFSSELVAGLVERHTLKGKAILDIGCGQGEFLREFEPDFFFDDQTGHVNSAALHVPSGHVASGVSNLR